MSENLNDNQPPEETEISRDQSNRGAGGNASRRKLLIPSEEQCIAALFQIPPMMLTGMISTAQASVTKAVYNTILQNLRQPKVNAGGTSMSAPSLIDNLRQNQSMLDSLEPMMTQNQFNEIKKQVGGENEAA